MPVLEIRAGAHAIQSIRRNGLNPSQIRIIAGAAGGPKFLALTRLDQAILDTWFQDWSPDRPIHTIGSSIGAVRFSMWAQNDPIAAIRRLEENYLTYEWEKDHNPERVTGDTEELILRGWEDRRAESILHSTVFRNHIMTVRGRGLLQKEDSSLFAAGIAASFLGNTLSRKTLGLFFDRCIFHDPRATPPIAHQKAFPTRHTPLTARNMMPALLASCSVPFVMDRVNNIPGARPGYYRDGGIIDYHLDVPFMVPDESGLVLFPHFGKRIVPGWFDKALKWRKPGLQNMKNVVLLAPSDDFIETLPGGHIPERKDFTRMDNATRRAAWAKAVQEFDRLADDFRDVASRDLWAARVKPLDVRS